MTEQLRNIVTAPPHARERLEQQTLEALRQCEGRVYRYTRAALRNGAARNEQAETFLLVVAAQPKNGVLVAVKVAPRGRARCFIPPRLVRNATPDAILFMIEQGRMDAVQLPLDLATVRACSMAECAGNAAHHEECAAREQEIRAQRMAAHA